MDKFSSLIIPSGVFIVNLFFAIYVISKNPRHIVHRSFFIFSLGIALWAGALAATSISGSFVYVQVALFGGHTMILGFTILGQTFPDKRKLNKRTWVLLSPLILLFVLTPFRVFIKNVYVDKGGHLIPQNGSLFFLLAWVVGSYILIGISALFRRFRGMSGISRVRVKYLLAGGAIFLGGVFIFDLALPTLGFFELNEIGPICSFAFTGFTAYAIIKHRFLNIKLVFQKGILYILTIGFISSIFLALQLLINSFAHRDRASDLIAAIGSAFGFLAFRQFLEKKADNIFFRKDYDYSSTVEKLGPLVSGTLEESYLIKSVLYLLKESVKPSKVFFVSQRKKGLEVLGINRNDIKRTKDRISNLLPIFKDLPPGPILIQELNDSLIDEHVLFRKADLEVFMDLQISAIIVLPSRDDSISLFFLGEKLSDEIYRPKDIALLNVVAHHVGIALENSRLYGALAKYNEELETRVLEKTERLKKLYEAQAHFLTDISHELQTPIAIMEGNLDILEDAKNSEAKRALRVAQTTLKGMEHLVKNLLEIGRLNFSKKKLHKSRINLRKLLVEVQEDCFVLAANKGILLEVTSDEIFILGERQKLKEVLFNLMNNALEHTGSDGTISLSAERENGRARLLVVDTGSGIDPKEAPHIFERFYRIRGENYQGSGLGLNICSEIIKAHGGTIAVESKLGEGSTFVITLPTTS